MKTQEYLLREFGITQEVFETAKKAEEMACKQFEKIDKIKEYNQYKVIRSMQRFMVSDTMFSGTTGYGYDDRGRDVLDSVYADAFGAEAAIVRQQIVSGTHALALCLFGILRPGMNMVSVTGKPYDTLEEVIGIRDSESVTDSNISPGSLKDFGVEYRQVDLLPSGEIDFEKVRELVDENTGLLLIQRSRGYEWRNAFTINQIRHACETIRDMGTNACIMVDNCYGEFVEREEPVQVGADIMAGSLIKNPGGGIATTGGYVAGKKELVGLAANRLTSPGLGGHVGPSLGQNRLFYQGFFLAPHVVAESLKGAVFCGYLMELLGFDVSPKPDADRGDIIQAVRFGAEEPLISFCQGIQKGSPIDSFVDPIPWEMPGYANQVIMAAGAFVQGSSIELSADAPLKDPFIGYMQGGLVYDHVKLGLMIAVQRMKEGR